MKILLNFAFICLLAVNASAAPLAHAAKNSKGQTSKGAQYKTPQAAVKAFVAAWRTKNRPAMRRAAEADVVSGIGNLIKGSTFRGCTENTESARKAYNCTVQAGDDDLTAVYLEVVLTRLGYRIMAIDYAAAH